MLYRLLTSASLPVAPAFALATVAGVACSVFGATFWRKLVIAIGFPLLAIRHFNVEFAFRAESNGQVLHTLRLFFISWNV